MRVKSYILVANSLYLDILNSSKFPLIYEIKQDEDQKTDLYGDYETYCNLKHNAVVAHRCIS
jgi:hypothetical protein